MKKDEDKVRMHRQAVAVARAYVDASEIAYNRGMAQLAKAIEESEKPTTKGPDWKRRAVVLG